MSSCGINLLTSCPAADFLTAGNSTILSVMLVHEQKYFVALIPPEPLRSKLQGIKERIGTDYHTRAALRSPPHITLHMPFLWSERKEHKLTEALSAFALKRESLNISLNGFSSFPPRVVFIAVEHNEVLIDLQFQLFRYCKTNLNIFNANYKDRPFHPHITLAFRDLKKEKFDVLWQEIEHEPFQATFVASTITLLKHDRRQWNEYANFQLGSSE